MNFDELLAEGQASNNQDAVALAKRMAKDWDQGVIPAHKNIGKLKKLLTPPGPCMRLGYDGNCSGWLRKYGLDVGLKVEPPYNCPYAGTETDESQFIKCPGYRG